MLPLPRVAVGTIQRGTDLRAILWALMEAFRQEGLQVQSFLSQACFARYHGAATASGLHPRHLDSWLMSSQLCREILLRGMETCDLAVILGEFGSKPVGEDGTGGSLDTLCEWLDLPRLVVLDVSRFDGGRLPGRPEQVDAVLLDRVSDAGHLERTSAKLEALWGVPVLGGLEALCPLRAEIDAVPQGARPPQELCRQLGNQFLRHTQPHRVVELSFGREMAETAPRLFASPPASSPVVVALAYDAAINCYFPDTLDLLESRGATIVDFSPLRAEQLPPGTDVVYLGCGHPERYAAELSQNDCIRLALWNHVRNGGRIYAEGGGLAYLCQQIELAPGRSWRMVGIFPAVARHKSDQCRPTPVEVTLNQVTWLGRRGTRLRGYQNPGWHLEPAGALDGCVVQPQRQFHLVRSLRALGSQLHLNFVAQPELLSGFFEPLPSQSIPTDPWTAGP